MHAGIIAPEKGSRTSVSPHGLHGAGEMVALVLLLVLAFVGSAQAHNWYQGLSSTLSQYEGAPCCGGQDCRGLSPGDVLREDGVLYLRAPDVGDWVEIDPTAILPRTSSDGRIHGCWWGGSRIWGCVILPPSM
jgi:hypothetical protein